MTWELVWMLVILKIPVIYLSLVVWWAVKSKPAPLEPALLPATLGIDPRPGWRFLRGPRRLPRGPHGSPSRGYRRASRTARARS